MMPELVQMVSHEQNCYVTPPFDCPDLRNTMNPLMVLSRSHDVDNNAMASHDSNTNASGIT